MKFAWRSSKRYALHCWQMTSRTPWMKRRRRVGEQAHCRGGWCGAMGGGSASDGIRLSALLITRYTCMLLLSRVVDVDFRPALTD